MDHHLYIVGLGNPGLKYRKTRHNIGWLVLDQLAGKTKWQESKNLQGQHCCVSINGKEVELIKPTTFMNCSGQALAYIQKKHPQVKPHHIFVVHDDKDLEFGRIKFTEKSGSAGHNGVKSIIEALGTEAFPRIRIGAKNEQLEKMPTDKFVLSKFSREERKILDQKIIPEVIIFIEEYAS